MVIHRSNYIRPAARFLHCWLLRWRSEPWSGGGVVTSLPPPVQLACCSLTLASVDVVPSVAIAVVDEEARHEEQEAQVDSSVVSTARLLRHTLSQPG